MKKSILKSTALVLCAGLVCCLLLTAAIFDAKTTQQTETQLRSLSTALSSAYDAMTTSRSYRPAMSPSDALFEIRRNLGTQFDPKIGLVFIEMIEATLSPIQPASTVV